MKNAAIPAVLKVRQTAAPILMFWITPLLPIAVKHAMSAAMATTVSPIALLMKKPLTMAVTMILREKLA